MGHRAGQGRRAREVRQAVKVRIVIEWHDAETKDIVGYVCDLVDQFNADVRQKLGKQLGLI